MKVIGITGGVGAGKSSILKFIEDNTNSKIIMADDLAKELCLKGERCYEPLVALLSKEVCGADGEIDRGRMAAMIFADSKLLKRVNEIIHPAVKEYIKEQIALFQADIKVDFFFIEAALLIEDGYKAIVDELWYIYTDKEIRRKRLKESRGYSDAKIDSIFASQLSDEEFRSNSDFVIDNSGTEEESFDQIRKRLRLDGR